MKITRKGPVFAVDFRDPSGKRTRPSTGVRIPFNLDGSVNMELYPKAEAEAYEQGAKIVQGAMLAAAAGGGAPSSRLLEKTLGNALQRQYREHWSRRSYGTSMKHVVNLLVREMGHLPLSKVTYAELKSREAHWLQSGLANATVNRRMAAIGLTLRECEARKELWENGDPSIPGKVPKIPHLHEDPYVKERFLQLDEEAKLLGYMDQMAVDDVVERRPEWVYMKHLSVFLIDTGFRFSEAFEFTLEGVTADLRHGCTKNTLGRRVPLTERALEAARFLLSSSHHRDLKQRTTPARPKAAWDWCAHRFEKACRAIAINPPNTSRNQRITMHSCRHTCASRMVQSGVDLYVVCKWMGHSSIKITMRYAKLAPKTFTGALAALEGKVQVIDVQPQMLLQAALIRRLLGLEPDAPLPSPEEMLKLLGMPTAPQLHGSR